MTNSVALCKNPSLPVLVAMGQSLRWCIPWRLEQMWQNMHLMLNVHSPSARLLFYSHTGLGEWSVAKALAVGASFSHLGGEGGGGGASCCWTAVCHMIQGLALLATVTCGGGSIIASGQL